MFSFSRLQEQTHAARYQMGEKYLMCVFIKASVPELKIHSVLVAGRYGQLLRQMGVSRRVGYTGCSMCGH